MIWPCKSCRTLCKNIFSLSANLAIASTTFCTHTAGVSSVISHLEMKTPVLGAIEGYWHKKLIIYLYKNLDNLQEN